MDESTTPTLENTAVMVGGSVEYALDAAAVEIEDMIRMLEDMRNEGFRFVVQASGNYRGAQWAGLVTESWAGAAE